MRSIRAAGLRLAATLIILAICFVCLELSYRAYKLLSYGLVDYPDSVTIGMYKFDSLYGTLPTPGFSSRSIPERIRKHPQVKGYDVNISFNRWGYRGRDFDFAKPPGPYRIVTLGGSTTQNVEVSDEDTWSAQLEAKLNNDPAFLAKVGARTVEVINAGLGGSRTREGLLRFEQDVVRMQPDLILVAYNWNDIHYGTEGYDPDQPLATARPWWHGVKILQNAWIRWVRFQDRSEMRWGNNLAHLRPDEYRAIVYKRNLIKMSYLSRKIGAQMMFVNLPGLCREAAFGSPEYSVIVENTRANPASFPYWVKIKQFAASTLQEVGRTEGVGTIDVSGYFERFSSTDRLRLFVDEMHTTKDGSEQIANAIYAYLAARP